MSATKIDAAAHLESLQRQEIELLAQIALQQEKIDADRAKLRDLRQQRTGLRIGMGTVNAAQADKAADQ